MTVVRTLVTVVFLTSCQTTRIADQHVRSVFDDVRAPIEGDGYVLHFIQLDDQGFFRDRDSDGRSRQLSAGLHDIRSAGLGNSMTVVFVHGWKHNSEQYDQNALCFQSLLTQLVTTEKRGRKRRVIGIYLSWQGKTAQSDLLQQLTFWDRKKAIDTIASSGRVTYVLTALDDLARTAHSPLVIIGHSFGARLVFEAVSQPIISEVMRANDHVWGETLNIVQTPIQGFGDLVILLNPAFEAAKYDTFDLFARTAEGFPMAQRPRLLILATNNDEATLTWFPRGMRIDLKSLAKPPAELITTVGNFTEFQTHVLLPCDQVTDELAPPHRPDDSPANPCACATSIKISTPLKGMDSRACYGGLELRKTRSGGVNSPFIVARTDYRVIDGHNGIFSQTLLSFILEYINTYVQQNPAA